MTEKEAILRDLKVIAILDKKIDYSDHDSIGAVLKLNPGSLFSTRYGDRYLDRVRKMYNGEEYDHTCILCGATLKGGEPVCENCFSMITMGDGKTPEAPKQKEEAASDSKEELSGQKRDETSAGEDALKPEPEAGTAHAGELPEIPETEKQEFGEEAAKTQIPDELKEADVSSDATATDDQKAHDTDVVSRKGRRNTIARVFILLFAIVCLSVGIVCGMILIFRDLKARQAEEEAEEQRQEMLIEKNTPDSSEE